MILERDGFTVLDAAVPAQRAQWLAAWQTWSRRDVVAHPGYAELFAGPGDQTICACQNRADGGILFPLIVRSLKGESWVEDAEGISDLTSPYGYGGPFGWGTYSAEEFWQGFDAWTHSVRAVALFTRFSLFKEELIPFHGDVVVKGPCVIVPVKGDGQSLLRSYEKTARENVRQAERAGVSVEIDLECRRLDEFLSVYHSTMKRLDALPMYFFARPFFERLLAGLPRQAMLVHGIYQQQVVSSEMLLQSEDHVYSFLGGTLEAGLPVRANPLLRHAVNVWAAMNGKQFVVLGGGYAGKDSLLRYKQRFAPTSAVEFAVGTRILDPARYQSLVEQRIAWERRTTPGWLPDPGFFPAYRS